MPGTNALSALYKDPRNSCLVTIFVRYGKHSMPFFRKTEISDKELQYLGEYLGRNYK